MTSTDTPLPLARKHRLDPHVRRVAVVVVLGSVMTVLDTTIVNVALATLSRDLHTGLNDIQWVVTAYLLALAAVIPIGGWTVRRFSAFRVFMHALVLFTIGSALCGLATSATELILFRALQGLGGGLLMPTGMTLLVQTTGQSNLPRVMSAIGTPMVIAPIFGPTLGGFLLQSISWHAIFMINVPIGLVTAVVATRLLPRDRDDSISAGRLDVLGLLLAGAGTLGITFALSRSASAGRFISGTVLLPALTGLLAIAIFVRRARGRKHPLLDLTLYSIRAYSCATIVMFFLGAAVYGSMILLPLYFQDVRSEDAIRTGLLLVPQGVGAAIGMNRSAQATHRFGAGVTALAGVSIVVAATVPYLFVGAGTPYWLIGMAMFFRGLGMGLAFMPATTAAFSVLSHDQVNDASPQLNVIQRIGGSLGTAIVAVVLQAKLATTFSPQEAGKAFAHTYQWVILMSAVALIPAAILWRVERRNAHVEKGDLTEIVAELIV